MRRQFLKHSMSCNQFSAVLQWLRLDNHWVHGGWWACYTLSGHFSHEQEIVEEWLGYKQGRTSRMAWTLTKDDKFYGTKHKLTCFKNKNFLPPNNHVNTVIPTETKPKMWNISITDFGSTGTISGHETSYLASHKSKLVPPGYFVMSVNIYYWTVFWQVCLMLKRLSHHSEVLVLILREERRNTCSRGKCCACSLPSLLSMIVLFEGL